jgi:RHS repeat-associated protein
MTWTDQQASRSEACLASKDVCWLPQTESENPQASYYRARYYDTTVGRFLNEDPNWFDGGPNVYNYVEANPVNFVDPDGLNRLSYDQIAAIVAANNRSGQSNELIICMAYKESSFDTDASLPGNQSARGLLGVTDPAARDEGVDYDNPSDPATNISTGSDYLNNRIRRRHGNVAAGLAGYGTGRRYANSLLNCEKCLITRAGEKSDCKTKDCLEPMHAAPHPKPKPSPKTQ